MTETIIEAINPKKRFNKEDYVHKRLVALEMYELQKRYRDYLLVTAIFIFICAAISFPYSVVAAAVAFPFIGYIALKAQQKMNYLSETYNIETKKEDQNNDE